MKTTLERFWAKVVKQSDDCWIWVGASDNREYGFFYWNGKQGLAHRYSYETFREPIPVGMTIDHLCCRCWCVNPDHMEVVTRGENTLRGNAPPAQNKLKTHCLRGHPFDETNTYIDQRGNRSCKACFYIRCFNRRRVANPALGPAPRKYNRKTVKL